MKHAPRRLDLDFRATRRKAPWAGWLMLALSLGFIADLGVSYYNVQAAIEQAHARLARMERPRPQESAGRSRVAAQTIAPEEIANARETYLRLATPWNDLFAALEATLPDRVTLTAIEPDTKAGTVVISGEARDYAAVLDYVVGLQRAKTFDRVHLVRHELRQNDQQRSAAFAVSAKWSEATR